jgi:hypothetical protein
MTTCNNCDACLRRQQENDRLTEENLRLRAQVRVLKRKLKQGPFGSSTPSGKVPIKPNTPPPPPDPAAPKRKRGAQPGHKGHSRPGVDPATADQVIDVPSAVDGMCSDCQRELETFAYDLRLVMDGLSSKVSPFVYRSPCERCTCCGKVFHSPVPGVLPRALYGNSALANAVYMHYLVGIPLGRVCELLGLDAGTLVKSFHRLAKIFDSIPARLIEEYRQALVRHADETGWRTQGKNGYVWLFATESLSIFTFRATRSGSVAREVFGDAPLPGFLAVDRYAGYNKMPCAIQYCYAHLLREVQDLEKDFPDSSEVKTFVATVAPLLALAMGLRSQKISDTEFLVRAAQAEADIRHIMEARASNLAIQRIQDIFIDNEPRLYHWAKDRRVPAENNLAERDLRPTVIARKTSFGSQSDAGAHTRGVLMSVLYSMKKRGLDVQAQLTSALNAIAKDMSCDPYPLLFSGADSSG